MTSLFSSLLSSSRFSSSFNNVITPASQWSADTHFTLSITPFVRYTSSADHIPSSLPLNCAMCPAMSFISSAVKNFLVWPLLSQIYGQYLPLHCPLRRSQLVLYALRVFLISLLSCRPRMPFLPRLLIHSACFDWLRHWKRLPQRPLSPWITEKWLPVKVSARWRRFLIQWKIGDSKQSTMCQRSKLPVVLTSRVLLFYNYIFTVVIYSLTYHSRAMARVRVYYYMSN